jgi:HSP20 family protein
MAEAATKVPEKVEGKKTEQTTEKSSAAQEWRPFDSLRREIDRLFDDFGQGFWRSPFRSLAEFEPVWSRKLPWGAAPAVDIVEGEKAYEVTVELPGMDEKNIEVKVAKGGLTIKGEKKEEKEEKKKDYYLSERRFGSFERYFRLPDGIDADKIEANFKKGVLTVTLPKKPEAQKPEKKINVKSG